MKIETMIGTPNDESIHKIMDWFGPGTYKCLMYWEQNNHHFFVVQTPETIHFMRCYPMKYSTPMEQFKLVQDKVLPLTEL